VTTRRRKKAQGKPNPKSPAKTPPLCDHVRCSLNDYFNALNGHDPSDLYDFVVSEVEQPLFAVVMSETGGNITRAAEILGINRGTLRKKLRKYGLNE